MYRISSDGENKWEFTVTDGVPDRVEIPEEYLEDWHYERLSRYTDTVKPEIIPYYVEYRDRGETQSIRRLLCWDGGLDQPFAVGGIGLDEFIRSCQTELPEDEVTLAKMREQLADYFLVDASWDWWRWFDNPEVRDSLRKFVKEEFDMETYQRITGSDVVWYPSDTGDERYALYPNGGIYWGSAENGIRVSDGFGNWWYDDEDGAISYDGDWQNDLPNGSGSVIFGNDHGWTDNDYEYEENVSEPAYGNFVNGVGIVDIGGTMREVVVRGVDGGTGTANTGDVILDVNNLSEEQKNMFEVMDSLGYYMCNPMLTNLDYEPQDSEFFWGAMWRLILLYAPNVNDGTGRMPRTEDWSLAVDESLIEEYATALFADYNGIPALPEMYGVTRTADDVYTFGPGERALDYGKLVSWTEHSDGTSTVVTQLLNEMDVEPYGEYEFTLVKNQYADQFENPRYLYSVADVKER
ncbi:MAG: hypothetical protein LUE86_07430 [Clostridiales bacterium]|nr:hypothetical protein [Clostridiales bacterium]